MSAKTIFLLILAVLVTIILMKNTDEVNFWIFGERSIPKLAVLGFMFLAGGITGYIIGRPRRKPLLNQDNDDSMDDHPENPPRLERNSLSDEDREYIS